MVVWGAGSEATVATAFPDRGIGARGAPASAGARPGASGPRTAREGPPGRSRGPAGLRRAGRPGVVVAGDRPFRSVHTGACLCAGLRHGGTQAKRSCSPSRTSPSAGRPWGNSSSSRFSSSRPAGSSPRPSTVRAWASGNGDSSRGGSTTSRSCPRSWATGPRRWSPPPAPGGPRAPGGFGRGPRAGGRSSTREGGRPRLRVSPGEGRPLQVAPRLCAGCEKARNDARRLGHRARRDPVPAREVPRVPFQELPGRRALRSGSRGSGFARSRCPRATRTPDRQGGASSES